MKTIFILLLLMSQSIATDFKITIDDEIAAAITWARERDNSCLCRDKNSQITSDDDYIQIEFGAWAKQLLKQKLDTDVKAAGDAVMEKQSTSRAKLQ